ncbi:MAG: hypothetical protein M3457_09960 [Chloroflexota bacterium]|nr:hypothetical protein [Chloroflexota bacterium]
MNNKRSLFMLLIALISALAFVPASPSLAQENPPPQPIDLPCVTDVSVQVLGMTPVNDGTQNLVQARVIFAPGGGITEHTHPGTLVLTVESGTFGFTHMSEGEMVVTRAATADGEAVTEPLVHGEEMAVNPGDWLVETGMIHTGASIGDEPATVLLTGLIEAGQPLTICVDEGTPVASAT